MNARAGAHLPAVALLRQAAHAAASAVPRPVALSAGVLLVAAATALGARVAVPLGFTPVPMTFQTLVVLLVGALLGPGRGAASQLAYLGLGAAGAPVFAAGGTGLPWLLGPTGGYLLAFPLAAAAVGWIGGPGRGALRSAAGLAVGTATVFALGAAWLAAATGAGPREAFALGVQPFLAGAAIKGAVAFVVVRRLTGLRRNADARGPEDVRGPGDHGPGGGRRSGASGPSDGRSGP